MIPSYITNPYYNAVLYSIGKWFTKVMFNVVWRREAEGLENIPPAGTATLFAANHRSYADPNLVGTLVPYPIHYFAKEELFRVPLLGWYIRRVNSFPVRRAVQDRSAMKTAQTVLENGGGLLIFPEGGRRLRKETQWVAKPGIGMLACQTGAQVVPVHIQHSERFAQFAKIRVIFGKPMKPPKTKDRDSYDKFSQHVMDAARALVPEGKK